jgi:hypothetical protein
VITLPPDSTTRSRPIFLSILAVWLSLAAVAALVLGPWLLFGSADSYSINDVPVSREEFLKRSGPLLASMPILAIAGGVAAWYLWSERYRGRLVTLAVLILTVVGPGFVPSLQQPWSVTVVSGLAVALPLLWYFYRKPNVVAYYESLPR